LLLAVPAMADYQAGLDAYSEGAYRLAMREWIDVTEQPPGEVNPNIYAEAHYAVARLYWDGLGTTRDYFAAHEWLVKAADLGHAGAMSKLGYLHTDGIVVEQDFNQAFRWYSEAARLGDVDALYNLGVCYLNGWGTPPDRTMAKQYLAAASAQGDPAAEQALQALLEEEERSVGATSVATATVGATSVATPEVPEEDSSRVTSLLQEEEEPVVGATSVATPESPEEERSRVTSLLQEEDWILAQNPDHYTIQVIGLSTREKLEELVADYEDLAPMAVYVVQRNTRPIHVLVQGVYPTV
jgi:hypothetical protein